jgi:signal transduction histidine kinase
MAIGKRYMNQHYQSIDLQNVSPLEKSSWSNNRKINPVRLDKGISSISRQNTSDERLQKCLSLFNAVLESAADGIIALDYQGEILNFNQKLLEVWEISLPDSFSDLENSERYLSFCKHQLKEPDRIDKLIRELDRPSEPETSDVWHLKNGRVIERYSKPLIVGGDNIGRVWSFRASQDIQRAEELNRQLNREKELSEQRARFVSMVSHEFRIPLNIISFAASLLKRHGDRWSEEKKLNYFDRLQSAVEQLSSLMDEVLIIGRAEAGKLVFETTSLDLAAFCQEIVSEMHLREKNHQRINFVCYGDRRKVEVDKKILRRILINLLSNAIKYSPDRHPVELILDFQNQKTILTVKDRGIGIPELDRQKLFESFYRGSNVGDLPGHGLGLAIVKKLADIHGAQISVESEVGKGTTFSLCLEKLQK